MKGLKPATVEEYIANFPEHTQELLHQMRELIRSNAPDAKEEISYGMPGYKLNKKPLVYFAGYDKHIGFYATPVGHSEFAEEFSKYKTGKGSVQFPIDQPLPEDLIIRVVKFRVKGNLEMKK
ncbi:iron chaperone [Jiulongibacter sediminis]|mgnify:CR=1 FL=1|jgi:uncharacterized protein YdhG (YjbR/CyaY superfamily)|uniref:iron chaperone n=1 Tax=Jiulongibacter sediminis TaxID=1605367 RepID=UPI0026F18AA2|nr:DUF1801 domain-containing protein [Jiulongibacter sediminis]